MPTVSLREVSKFFTDVPAVNRVSFDVEQGELLVLLGPSGCGKTTTLRMIAGLEEPDGGEIFIGDKVVNAPAKGIVLPTEKRGIGMVFQSYAIWPNMKVFENVAYPLRVRRTRPAIIRDKVMQALSLVGLEGLEERPATQLSGGQQQRVALARAIVFEPSLLLLDEPLSNLDAKLRVQMRVELKKLLQKTGITSLYVTHDQAESMALADRIIVMNRGSIEQIGSSEEIYERPRTKFVADFVGSINTISAQVVDETVQNGCIRVKPVACADELLCEPRGEFPLTRGQKVLVSVRPEKIALHRHRPTGISNVLECHVVSAVYYGDRREYDLSAEGEALKVLGASDPAIGVGEKVFATISPRDLVLLKWDEQSPQ
jgi:iron(III) transport system ATP-binding protein